MIKWRYAAFLKHQRQDAKGDVLSDLTARHYEDEYLIESEQDGLDGLEGFYEARQREHGDNFILAALEKSDSGVNWQLIARFPPN